MAAFDDHIADPLRRSIWLVEITTTLLSDGSAATLRYSSDTFATGPGDSPASTLYQARLVEPISFTLEAADPDVTGWAGAYRGGSIRLGSLHGDLDTLPDVYALQGSAVRVLLGGYTPSTNHHMTYAEFGEVGLLEITSPEVGEGELVLGTRDRSYRLDDRIERRYYGGRDHCGRFDNGASYFARVTYAAPAKLDITGDLTVEAWLYIASFSGAFTVVTWTGASAYPYHIQVGGTGRVSYLDSSQTRQFSASTLLATGRWYHLSIARNSAAGTLRKVLYDLTTNLEVVETLTSVTLPSPANVGGTFTVGNNFRGLLSDVRVYNADLSADQIRNRRWDYLDVGSDPLASNLKYYCRLNESTTDESATPATATTVGTATYLPTCDGEEDLEGEPVPVCYGIARNVKVPLVDARKYIYQVADLGGDVSSVVVMEGGAVITAGSNRATLLDLVATAPTAGTWDWHYSGNGAFFRLGSKPTLPITATVTMVNDDLANVVADLLTERGTSPFTLGDLDLDLTKAPDVGWHSDGKSQTIRQALEYLLSGVASYWVRRDGTVVARILVDPSGGSPVATLTDAQVASWKEEKRIEPVWLYRLKCRRNWHPLEGDALVGSIVGTVNEAFFRREWNYARRSDRAILGKYARARMVDRESAIDARGWALEIAQARLDLLNAPGRVVSVRAALAGLAVDRFDVVTLDVANLGDDGGRVERLTGNWVVLGLAESAADGLVELKCWRRG